MKKEAFIHFLKSHLFIISVSLLLKIMLLRFLLFEEVNFIKTAVLELCYIVLFAALIELTAAKWKPVAFFLFSFFFSILFLAAILYHSYFGRIATYFALFQAGQIGTVRESVVALLDPIFILFFADIIILAVLLAIRKYPLSTEPLNARYVVVPVLLAALAVISVNISVHKDEVIANNVAAAEQKGFLTYELLEIAFGPAAQAVPMADAPGGMAAEWQNEIRKLKGLPAIPIAQRKFFGDAEGRNLIAIQVESMQNFPLRLEVGGHEATPNLNKLLEKSFYFPNTVQQTGPGNTSDAEFIFNTSLYPVAHNPTSQTYGTKRFPGLPRLLNEQKYATMTFHADDIEFWNRDELYPALGFKNFYYGDFFGNEDVIGIGPSDEVMFAKALPVLRGQHAKGTPFYAHLIGLTSHHPFSLPAEKRELPLPDQFNDSLAGNYLISMHYTDRIIHHFIEQLKAEGIYENSIIAIYGDHFGLQQSAISERDVDLVSDLLGHEYGTLDRLNVPFIIHAPGITDHGQTFDQMSGQLDMMPTLANLLGLPLDGQAVFGQDLLNHKQNLLGIRYNLPAGSFWNEEILFMPEKGFEDGSAYDLDTKTPLDDFSRFKADYDRIVQLENLSDAYLASLPER